MKYLKFFKNKYIIITALFVIWMIFLGSNSLLSHLELQSEISELEEQKEYYEDEHKKDSTLIKELNKSQKSIEKYAREKYLMHKDNEDVFIFKEEIKEE